MAAKTTVARAARGAFAGACLTAAVGAGFVLLLRLAFVPLDEAMDGGHGREMLIADLLLVAAAGAFVEVAAGDASSRSVVSADRKCDGGRRRRRLPQRAGGIETGGGDSVGDRSTACPHTVHPQNSRLNPVALP